MFIYKVTTTKVHFRFSKQCSQAAVCHICERTIFGQNAGVVCSSNISPYIVEKSREKFCKILEMELKMYTLVGPKFVLEKIKFRVLHYIQHNFIRQRPGLSKDQISMFKSLVINCFIFKYNHTF